MSFNVLSRKKEGGPVVVAVAVVVVVGGGDISANMVSHVAMELKFILRDFLIEKFKWNSCSGKYFPWNFSHISHIFSENIIRN